MEMESAERRAPAGDRAAHQQPLFHGHGRAPAKDAAELVCVPRETPLWLIQEAGPAFVAADPSAKGRAATGTKSSTRSAGKDDSRSGIAFRKAMAICRAGTTFEEMCYALAGDPETADWVCEKGEANDRRELRRIWEKAKQNHDHSRPAIQVQAGRLDTLATEAESALIESGLPVFQRGRSLVRPIKLEVPASRGRVTVAAGIKELATPGLLDLFAQAAPWERYDGRRKEVVVCDPPAQVASILLSRAVEWRLPPIAGVITTPTLRRDGSILSAAGYDATTRLYLIPDPALQLPAIAEAPSKADAAAALDLLDTLLSGFPFVSPTDRAVALSALLTPVVRGAMAVAPLHALRATTASSGKSYLADLASAIATGRPCPVVAAGQNDEETEKRLVALLLAGFPLVSLDNVNGELGGDLLCQAIERPLIRIRPLGRSEIVEIESRATIFATGNALRVRGDMTRRTVSCSLDAGVERPELRTFAFDPGARVLADRGRYIAAALTVARAYITAWSPDPLPSLASFEDWSDVVPSALVWLGRVNPVVSMEAAREDDPELAELREVIGLWQHDIGITDPTAGRDPITARELAEQDAFSKPVFRDALLRIAGERGAINTKRLGRWLLSHEGRIGGGLAIKCCGTTRDGAARWGLYPASGRSSSPQS